MIYKKPIQLGVALVGFALAAYTLPAATTWSHLTDSAFNWTDSTQWTTSGDVPSTTYPDTAGDVVIVQSSGTATRNVTLPGSGVTIGTLLSGKGGTWNPGVAVSRYFNFTGGALTMDNTGGPDTSGTGKPTVGGANSSYGDSVYGNLAGNQGVAFYRNVPIGLNANTFTGDADLVDATTVRTLSVDALPHGGRTGNVNFTSLGAGFCALDLWGNSITINGLNAATGLGHQVLTANGGNVTLTVGDNNANGNFGGAINNGNGTMNLTKIGTGTQVLAGINTYTGDTTVNGGGELDLASGARLTFAPGANGVNNWITGDGTGTVNLDGIFSFSLGGADATTGNSWNIVDLANAGSVTYGGTFGVLGFTDEGGGVWDLQSGASLWTYDTSTSVLSVVPEPTALVLGLVGGLGMLLVVRRRRLA